MNHTQGQKKTKKVLFLVNDLGIGGVQRLVVDFANYLDKEKFDITVGILLARQKSYFYRDQLRPEVHFVNFSFRGFLDFREWWKLFWFMKKQKFDIVFTQLIMSDFIGRITAFLAGVPVIITEIQNIIPDMPRKLIIADQFLAHITNVCISTTPAITRYARETIGFPQEKIIEIPTNAIDASRFLTHVDKNKFRKDLDIPENAKIAINIGRLVEQKGQSILLKAAQRVLERNSNVYFLIVGSGASEDALKAEAMSLGITKNIRFLGSRKDTPELLMNSDVFVFPSIWEGQGLILFEAIFAHIPIVASRVGGIPDVIKHEITGLLSLPKDSGAIAENIIRIFENPELAKTLSATAFERYKDRTIENAARKLENLFVTMT